MLSVEDNERLTRVGPGTPMGNAFRQFWLPFMLSDELANDAPPRRVRLLGEDLIAFRDTQGRPGLVDRYCPHRRADLYFGRNEQCGLRCAYHGWKFDVDGNVTDMPAEPANTPLLQDVKIKAYPMRDWGGVLWAYMGDPATMPDEVPQFEWGLVPPHRRFISKRLQQNNYAQAVEGGIDSAHVGILHSLLEPEPDTPFRQRQLPINPNLPLMAKDTAAFEGRSVRSLQRVSTKVVSWNADGKQTAVIGRLQSRLAPLCGRADAAAAERATCGTLLPNKG